MYPTTVKGFTYVQTTTYDALEPQPNIEELTKSDFISNE